MKLIQITESDTVYRVGLAELLINDGCVPLVFEAPDDFDLNSYEGLGEFKSESETPWSVTNTDVANYLNTYTGTNPFIRSLAIQLIQKGRLSEKQVASVKRAMIDLEAPKGDNGLVDHALNGKTLLLSKFISNKISAETRAKRSHRAFEVVRVKAETAKAYLAVVKCSARKTSTCICCGLTLENPESIAVGIGPICARKWGVSYGNATMEELAEILKLETIEHETWIPKSCIKETV